MVLKYFAKINLSLSVHKKLPSGMHDIQTIFCLVNLFDKITIKKIYRKNIDEVIFKGPQAYQIKTNDNSIVKILRKLREKKLISSFYSVKIEKRIPISAGLGGGTSNAATIMSFLVKKKIKKKKYDNIVNYIGSDLRLFFYNLGNQKNLETIAKINKRYSLYFLIVYPKISCSTKQVYSRVNKFSKRTVFSSRNIKTKSSFINYLKNSNNDLQSIVEKKHSNLRKLLVSISEEKGCFFSRMTGSGSACYGLFINKKRSKAALNSLKKRYPKFWFSIAKTI